MAAPDVRAVGWRLLVAAGAGGLAGMLVGGIGGRLLMLALRLTSSDTVLGLNTDDGFEIGRFTTSTFFLLQVTGGLGAFCGTTYTLARGTLPRRGRPAAWGLLGALIVGASILEPGNADFVILEPQLLAVAGFVLIPGLTALLVAVSIERLTLVAPWSSPRLALTLALGLVPLAPLLVAWGLLALVIVGIIRRPALAAWLHAVGRALVPVALLVAAVLSGVELLADTREIL